MLKRNTGTQLVWGTCRLSIVAVSLENRQSSNTPKFLEH